MNTPYCLVTDDGGHWFVIPVSKKDDWDDYAEATEEYWTIIPVDYSEEPPDFPKWADEVGGAPNLVEFKEYKIT